MLDPELEYVEGWVLMRTCLMVDGLLPPYLCKADDTFGI
jgi:hypothetical protein